MKTLKVVLVIFALFTAECFAFPFLREENPVFIVEVQSRPFSIPTDWITPAMLNEVESVTEDYAIFVWNKAGRNIVETFSSDDLQAVMEEYRSSVFARLGRDLLRLEVGKNRILNGKVVEVR